MFAPLNKGSIDSGRDCWRVKVGGERCEAADEGARLRFRALGVVGVVFTESTQVWIDARDAELEGLSIIVDLGNVG